MSDVECLNHFMKNILITELSKQNFLIVFEEALVKEDNEGNKEYCMM